MRKVKFNAAIFSRQLWERGRKRRAEKRELWRKENGCGYQKDSAHLLRFLSEYLKALREGGPLLALSLPPSLKMNPIEWERWSDAETARNKALTGLKQPPLCMTTNASLAELTAGNIRGTPKCPLFSITPSHCVNATFTCCTLRTTPPPLAGVGSHGELDPQCLAATRRMVDRRVHDLIDGVQKAGDILQDRCCRGVIN